LLSLIALISVMPAVLPPVRIRGTKIKLPRIVDAPFLERLAALSGKMKIPVPFARLWPSLTDSQQMLAFAGTLPSPQIVVTDGILRRLAADECDAIVAHELAHIANRSLWYLVGVTPVCCAIATALAAYLPTPFVVGFGLALAVGVRRLVSRHFELDCDRRAAQVIGFEETAVALAKIHAVHPVRNKGLLSLLVYATATHPSRDVRLWALHSNMSELNRGAITIDKTSVRRQQLATSMALAIWCLGMIGSLIAAFATPDARWPAWILCALAITPPALLLLAVRKTTSLVRRRRGTQIRWWLWLSGAYLAVICVAVFRQSWSGSWATFDRTDFETIQTGDTVITMLLPSLGFVACLVGWLLFKGPVLRLRARVLVALQVHDFSGAIALGRAHPQLVARDHLLRYNLALARAVCGDRATAISMLERLCSDKPTFSMAAILLQALMLESGEVQRALDIVQGSAPSLKGDPDLEVMAARALRRLGRFDEAQKACDVVLSRDPEHAAAHAMSAVLALERNDLTNAQRLIDRALELAPGDCRSLVVRAEIALQTRPGAEALATLEETVATVNANPLVFLQHEVERLKHLAAELALQAAVEESGDAALALGNPEG
jgi:predicted Zn-dependent protease